MSPLKGKSAADNWENENIFPFVCNEIVMRRIMKGQLT